MSAPTRPVSSEQEALTPVRALFFTSGAGASSDRGSAAVRLACLRITASTGSACLVLTVAS